MSTYRPQFAFKSPADCEEQRCVYSFDQTNTPVFLGNIQPGDSISRIPLPLDKDADFYLRGISTSDIVPSGLEIRIEDPKGHPLSDVDNLDDTINYDFLPLYSATDGAGIVALDNADDYGVYCQQGTRLYLHLFNNTTNVAYALSFLVLNLHGVKRYSGDRCAA